MLLYHALHTVVVRLRVLVTLENTVSATLHISDVTLCCLTLIKLYNVLIKIVYEVARCC